MMAPLLTPAAPRISQLLPTVKCSSCNRPVPVNELTDHVCPTTPALPKPTVSSTAAASLLPPHLQDRLPSPISPRPSLDTRVPSTASRASPLATTRAESPFARSRLSPSPVPTTNFVTSSPLRPRPGPSADISTRTPSNTTPPLHLCARTPSNASRAGILPPSSPVTARPSFSSSRDTPSPAPSPYNSSPPTRGLTPPYAVPPNRDLPPSLSYKPGPLPNMAPPSTSNLRPPGPPPRQQLPPTPPRDPIPPPPTLPLQQQYPEPDTKSGGEAGMAGVGRRGFAAAARAAMFVMPAERPMGPQPRRDNTTPFLNTDLPRRSNDTPPLSAGSGNSSHSPGVSPFPQSPVGQQGPPSPPDRSHDPKAPLSLHKAASSFDRGLPPSPSTLRKMPLDKLRNLPPPITTGPAAFFDNTNIDINGNSNSNSNNIKVDTPTTAKQPQQFNPPPRPPPRDSESESSFSLYSQGLASRSQSLSNSSTASRSRSKPALPTSRRPASPVSESGSDYSGLAYANSTDYEDEDEDIPAPASNSKGKANPPPPLPLSSGTSNIGGSILRTGSSSTSTSTSRDRDSDVMNHVRFPSSSSSSYIHRPRPSHGRKDSVSSVSSSGTGTGAESRRSNSAAVAHALGLSQAAPGPGASPYGRLGGPGGVMGGRARSATSSSAGSGGSASGSMRSRHMRGAGGSMDMMERELKVLLDEKAKEGQGQGAGLSKSKSTGRQRTFGGSIESGSGVVAGAGGLALSAKNPSIRSLSKGERDEKALASMDNDAGAGALSAQPPVRAKSTTGTTSESAKDKKERVRKPRVCLKCDAKIEDGRWVAVDNGGVLCERCWKNMYLPKCRRCNLPIEKAAVSSSDGQLKGKYHRECFNCHICHKPFPDKSFYVFDGKPLCAYHYHEANESLCAAARCGQPIEGPCAVSHTGDRYHPEHMVCEWPGGTECQVRLTTEYWEVDGRMLCERHAHASRVVGSDDEEGEEEWVVSSKKMKRVTRFIDLAGGGAGTGASRPSSEGLGLR